MSFFHESIWQPLTQVTFLVAVGVFCRRVGILSDATVGGLSKLVLQVTLPILLFISGAHSDLQDLAFQGPVVFLAGILIPCLGYGVGAVIAYLFKLSVRQASVIRVGASLSNTAFVGIPICTALWGTQGALLAALFDQGINVPLLTLAPLEYGRTSHLAWRPLLLSPMAWGLVAGILWNLSGWGIAPWADAPLSVLGNVTFPLSLILVGALTVPGGMQMSMLKPLAAFLSSRLVLVPMLVWGLTLLLGLHGTGAAVAVMQSAMPASVTATVMAGEYGADAHLAASAALLSVILSLVTIPIIAAMVVGA
jgi:predicted permease